MTDIVRCGLIQCSNPINDESVPVADIQKAALEKHYGTSYFVDPHGVILSEGSEDGDELVVADLDLDVIDEIRKEWQFYRDRRPDAYDELVDK